MGRSLQEFVTMLRHRGHRVSVASPNSDEPFLPSTSRLGGHLLFSVLLPFTFARWVRNKQLQLLALPIGPGGVFLLRRPALPLLGIVYHTYWQQSQLVPGQRWKKIFLPLERRTLRACKRILCYSSDTRDVLIDTYGIPADRIDVCAHPLDFSLWKVSAEREKGLCVCVARLEERKGVEVLLHAWKKIAEADSAAHLVIVGKGVQQRRIDALIASVPRARRVADISAAELHAFVARAEVAVCPAYLEGFGLAAVEAMASGTPVVASNAPGLRCLILHQQTGLSLKAGDSSALADAIITLLSTQSLRESLAAAAHSHVMNICDPSLAARDLARVVDACCVTNDVR